MNKDRRDFADYVYKVDTLNAIFAISSVMLVLTVVWMIWDDYDREWKMLQREANALAIEKTKAELEAAQQEMDQDQLAGIQAEMDEVEETLRAQQERLDGARMALRDLAVAWYSADQNARFAKAEYDVIKYEYETANHRGRRKEAATKKEALDAMAIRIDALRRTKEEVEAKRSARQQVLDGATREQRELEGQRELLLHKAGLLRRKLDKIEPSLANRLRNMPMVDFIDPSLKVHQVVVQDVKNDLNFTLVPKVDRCTTCHVNIDRADYAVDAKTGAFRDIVLSSYIEEHFPEEEWIGRTKVFASHPKLDLYLSTSSAHPMERMGCTVCHQGRDRGTAFVSAAHTPSDEAEADRWHQQYGWHEMHYWDEPMLPMRYVQASCRKCHQDVQEVPKADRLNRGIHLVKSLGCHGCHKIQGYEDARKVGPDLRKVAGKLERKWMINWVREPKAFRTTTKMPVIFDLPNLRSQTDMARNTAAVQSMVTYLSEKSERATYPNPPVEGDPDRGQVLVGKVGCRSCHAVGAGDDVGQEYGWRNYGPDLNGIGSKVHAGWLYAWLKDPKQYSPDALMPDLRLTDQETADITAYLMTLRNDEFEGRAPSQPDPVVRDDMIMEYLRGQLSDVKAREELRGMSDLERDLYLGEKVISRQGCFGCHLIPGLKGVQRIGAELTDEGSKDVDELDFGLNPMDIPHTRYDWFFAKLKHPRVFDEGRLKSYDQRLRMPDFGLNDVDAHAVTTALLSFRNSPVVPRARKQLTARETEVERGRRLVYDHNCRGCHVIEGRGGALLRPLAALYAGEMDISEGEAAGFTPPVLTGEGSKVQPEWFFRFLKQPEPIRPWLDVRMPSFGFEDGEATDIVAYFSALEGEQFPYRTFVDRRLSQEDLRAADILFSEDIFNCWTCHQRGSIPPKGDPASWAPDLTMGRTRLKPEWIRRWLQDPQKVQPGTKMPTYFGDEMTYLPEELAEYLHVPEGTEPEDGIIVLPSHQVIRALTNHIIYGLHQDVHAIKN